MPELIRSSCIRLCAKPMKSMTHYILWQMLSYPLTFHRVNYSYLRVEPPFLVHYRFGRTKAAVCQNEKSN